MIPRQIIIQAGGRGSRLEHFTTNRPKCLVPVDGKPLLYHTLAAFPGAEAVVIVDYRADVVARFLSAFPPDRTVKLFQSTGLGDGTAAGISHAARMLPYPDEPVAVVWCDLVFDEPPKIECHSFPVICTTRDFPCRLRVIHPDVGIAGLFYLSKASALLDVPPSGEFAEWMQRDGQTVQMVEVSGVREYGTLAALRDHWSATPCRFFNEVRTEGDVVIKRARDPGFQHLIDDEVAWYRHMRGHEFGNVPNTMSANGVLIMGRVSGRHPWQMEPSERVLGNIMDTIQRLHCLETAESDLADTVSMYRTKTLERIGAIPALLPPEFDGPAIVVNGGQRPNVARNRVVPLIDAPHRFTLIHGDPTFSNIIIGPTGYPYLIDPRGRFGATQFYGDPLYDWAKLYYSVVGSYDAFNRKQFVLTMEGGKAEVEIAPSGWEHLAPMFEERLGAEAMRKVRIIHGLIWLSLAGYVRDDYDAMLAAYFKGILTLEEALT